MSEAAPPVVLFACVHNAGRSQMAAAFFHRLVDPSKARAISAGTAPGPKIQPQVVEVMSEVGIALRGVEPRLLTEELAATASLLVTMGCGEACPVVPGIRRADWPLDDPNGASAETVRGIRDRIEALVAALVEQERWG